MSILSLSIQGTCREVHVECCLLHISILVNSFSSWHQAQVLLNTSGALYQLSYIPGLVCISFFIHDSYPRIGPNTVSFDKHLLNQLNFCPAADLTPFFFKWQVVDCCHLFLFTLYSSFLTEQPSYILFQSPLRILKCVCHTMTYYIVFCFLLLVFMIWLVEEHIQEDLDFVSCLWYVKHRHSVVFFSFFALVKNVYSFGRQ